MRDSNQASAGEAFNAAGGGVYVAAFEVSALPLWIWEVFADSGCHSCRESISGSSAGTRSPLRSPQEATRSTLRRSADRRRVIRGDRVISQSTLEVSS